MKKVGFISLGCPKNLVDSEVMMGQLKQNGYEITADAAEADTVVVNTCGFIDSAKKESIEAILEAAQLEDRTDKAKRLVVAGCLVERYRDELKAEMPEVDAFIGTSQINDILAVCDPKTNTRSLPVVPLGNQSATYLYDESTPRVLATPSALRVHQDRRRLRSSVRVLFHSADARSLSQPPLWIDRRRSASACGRRRKGIDPGGPGFVALRRRPGQAGRAGASACANCHTPKASSGCA